GESKAAKKGMEKIRQFLKDKAVSSHVFSMVDTLDPDPSVRLQIALTLGALQTEASATRLASLSHQHGSDRWMESAILSSANGKNGSWLSQWKGTPLLGTTMAGRRDSNAVMNQLLHLNHVSPETGIPFLQGLIAGASQGDTPWPEPTNGWDTIATQLAVMMTSRNAEVRKLASGFAARLPIDSSKYIGKFLNSAKKQALDEQTPLNQRVSAIEMLSIAPYETLAPVAIKLLDPKQPPSLQQASIISLGKSHDIRVARELIKVWPSLTPKSRTVVLETLLSQENRLPVLLGALEKRAIQVGDLSAIQREKLIQSNHTNRAKNLLAAVSSDADLPKRIARYQKALTIKRDGENGKSIYAKNCLICHKLDDQGNEIGPSLESISGKPDEGILMDILDPNGKIDPEYKLYLVTTSTGGSHAGVLANESATSLTLKRPDGKTDIILRKDIKTMTASEVSLMPANLHEQITPVEMADLVTFLRAKFGKK
ncbi:c-type cytochrome, partial [Akkermansiaceae bacterium]|nr:c-type cytochrome [Akkermansiaceae bacterium]